MKKVDFLSMVDESKCSGDKRCERICPSGAIKVVEKIAVVDENRCVACGKCIDVCHELALHLANRQKPLMIGFDADSVSQEEIIRICTEARCFPNQRICACTGTEAREAAAAIIAGASSPEDLVVMTGVGSGCGIYCQGIVFRLFKAAKVQIPEDRRWNSLSLALWDISEEIAGKHPDFYLEEDQKLVPVRKSA